MRREIATAVLTLPTAVLFLAGCTKQSVPEPVLETVTAGVAEQIQPDVPERYSASIEPFAQVDLAFKSGGIVERIYQVRSADHRMRDVGAGDRVPRGTQLAQVRPLDYQDRLNSAEAQRGQAQAQLAQARANFSEAEIEYTRDSNLFQSSSLVKPHFDQTKGRYESLRAAVTAAEEAVKAAEAAVTDANLSLRDTSLRAPFTGWITARNVERGSLVGGAVIGFSMIDTHAVKAVFAVADTSLSRIRTGQHQTVTLEALGYEASGIVTAISPQADPKNRAFSIEVTLNNSREQIRPGMIGSVILGTGTTHATTPRLVVPLSAVVRSPGDPRGFAVMLLNEREGKQYAASQVIEIGQTFGNQIEVTRGLRAGQKLIAMGGSLVHDGQEVHVLP